MLTTSQFRATAALHILLPKNPLPPQTTSFFVAAAEDMLRLLAWRPEAENTPVLYVDSVTYTACEYRASKYIEGI